MFKLWGEILMELVVLFSLAGFLWIILHGERSWLLIPFFVVVAAIIFPICSVLFLPSLMICLFFRNKGNTAARAFGIRATLSPVYHFWNEYIPASPTAMTRREVTELRFDKLEGHTCGQKAIRIHFYSK